MIYLCSTLSCKTCAVWWRGRLTILILCSFMFFCGKKICSHRCWCKEERVTLLLQCFWHLQKTRRVMPKGLRKWQWNVCHSHEIMAFAWVKTELNLVGGVEWRLVPTHKQSDCGSIKRSNVTNKIAGLESLGWSFIGCSKLKSESAFSGSLCSFYISFLKPFSI